MVEGVCGGVGGGRDGGGVEGGVDGAWGGSLALGRGDWCVFAVDHGYGGDVINSSVSTIWLEC